MLFLCSLSPCHHSVLVHDVIGALDGNMSVRKHRCMLNVGAVVEHKEGVGLIDNVRIDRNAVQILFEDIA